MALTDTFVRQVKPTGKTAGDKYTDGGAMCLLVKPSGARYWRMDYSYNGKRKTLALGVYPAVSLAKARGHRELLADDIDPGAAKRDERVAKPEAATHTFEVVARDWLVKTSNKRAEVTRAKVINWLEKDVFPFIGRMPIATIKAKDVLDKVARRMEARGIHESTHRIVQICSQVFRYAVATGLVERDVTADLRGALAVGDYENRIYVKIQNNGVGPLIVKGVVIEGAMEPEKPLINAMPELPPKAIWTNFVEEISGRSVPPGENCFWWTLMRVAVRPEPFLNWRATRSALHLEH